MEKTCVDCQNSKELVAVGKGVVQNVLCLANQRIEPVRNYILNERGKLVLHTFSAPGCFKEKAAPKIILNPGGSFICQSCGAKKGPRAVSTMKIIQTRKAVYKQRKTEEGEIIDRGGVGTEIVREIQTCGCC